MRERPTGQAGRAALLPVPRPAAESVLPDREAVSEVSEVSEQQERERRRRLGLVVRRAHLARRREVLLHLTRT